MGIRTNPITNLSTSPAKKTVGLSDPTILVIGQSSGTAGTSPPKKLVKNVSLTSLNTQFGVDSLLTHSIRKILTISESIRVDAIPLINPATGSTPSEGEIILTGTALESKTVTFRVFDDQFAFTVAIVKGAGADKILTDLSEAIDHAGPSIPFISTPEVGKLKITTRAHGIHMNGLISTMDTKVDGLTFSFKISEGGTGLIDTGPEDISDKDSIFYDLQDRYNTIIFDGSVLLNRMIPFLENRFDAQNDVLSGVGMTVSEGKLDQNMYSISQLYGCRALVIIGNLNPSEDSTAGKSKFNFIPLLLLAEIAAIRTLRLTENASIAKYVKNALKEGFGGMSKATLPYHNTPLSYKNSINDLQLSDAIIEKLKKAGINTLRNTATGNAVLGTMVTTKNVDANGNFDFTYYTLNNIDAIMVCQEYIFKNVKEKYSQSRLTRGEEIASLDMAGVTTIREFIKTLNNTLALNGITLSGGVAQKDFDKNLSVVIGSDGLGVNISYVMRFVNQVNYVNINAVISNEEII